MDRREEEKNRNKNRMILILLLLLIFLCVYIFMGGFFANEGDEVLKEAESIENVEDIPVADDPTEEIREVEEFIREEYDLDEDVVIEEDNEVEESELNEPLENDGEPEIEEIEEEEEEEVKPQASTKKFGLTFSQRNEIWWKYQKRQTEIQAEAKERNSDRFSKTYQNHVQTELKKLEYKLKQDYKINQGQLDYILQEGKDGKFNDAKIEL